MNTSSASSTSAASNLALSPEARIEALRYAQEALEQYFRTVASLRVAPELNAHELSKLRTSIEAMNFTTPLAPLDAVRFAVEGLTNQQVHTPHPRYFGLFNPAPSAMGIVADMLVAGFNPQMAAWSHSPFAAEIEAHLIRSFGEKFGYKRDESDGTFTSGGAEANHTALLTALVSKFPHFAVDGLFSLFSPHEPAHPQSARPETYKPTVHKPTVHKPTVYVSEQAHHSFLKAARFCGLGTRAVRSIPTDASLKMSVDALRRQIADDRATGCVPTMLVATAGTTSAGVIDPIPEMEAIAREQEMWFHLDAAWGGAAALLPEMASFLAGAEQADSITFDAHKFLSVPMAAGIYITRHSAILQHTCNVATAYMPLDAAGLDVVDPFTHSMQWSRRFIGLKVFLTLAVAGWEGYASTLRQQVALGELLRSELQSTGWRVVNDTPLPVVCFVDATHADGSTPEFLKDIARRIVQSGEAWVSTTLAGGRTVLRACITSYATQATDVQALVRLLGNAREAIARNDLS
jgi:glutamate/tyrosine decarboxylase-like PLP-dependent enzyme